MTNDEMIQEAVYKALITSQTISTDGKLNPKQANTFIDYVMDETELSRFARIVRFRNEQMKIEKIGIGTRAAVPKTEAVDPGIRRGITTSSVTLQPVEIMVPFEIGDIFREINIEGENVQDHIMRLFAIQLANDLEELYLNGNTLGPAVIEGDIVPGGSTTQYIQDNYLALFQGWLRLANSGNILDAANAQIDPDLISSALNEMPSKFRRNKKALRFLLSTEHEQIYRNNIGARMTQAGDAALNSQNNLTPYGVPLVPVPLLNRAPQVVENVVVNNDGVTATNLSYSPVTSVVVLPSTLGDVPTTAYVPGAGNDYTVDLTNGTITRLAGSAIGGGATVKVTYSTAGQMLLTPKSNLIIAIGRDIRLEKARNIFKGVNQFALTVKAFCQFEEITAVVKVNNIATT